MDKYIIGNTEWEALTGMRDKILNTPEQEMTEDARYILQYIKCLINILSAPGKRVMYSTWVRVRRIIRMYETGAKLSKYGI